MEYASYAIRHGKITLKKTGRKEKMPTGYTAKIKDGISFKEYALGCARAFGALITMRDEPYSAKIPEKIEPSDYHSKAIKKIKVELNRINSLTLDECALEAKKEYDQKCKYVDESLKEKQKQKIAYEEMLAKAKNYQPPSKDHYEYKKFMIEQIEKSIEFDCDISPSYYKYPNLKAADEFKNEKINTLKTDLKYHEKENMEEIRRAENRTLWIQQMFESLKEY